MKHVRRTCIPLLIVLAVSGPVRAADRAVAERLQTQHPELEARRDMVERAHQYLFQAQRDGMLGESRPIAVTAAFVLASLSSGYLPDHPEHGAAVQAAVDWILRHGTPSFLGGQDEPNADHALATLMLAETLGMHPHQDARREMHARCERAVDFIRRRQDSGVDAAYHGGWRPHDQTRVNDRVLTAWMLMALRSAELRGLDVPADSFRRGLDFILASQKMGASAKPEEHGGFSVDAAGLPVPGMTAVGLHALALWAPGERDRTRAALTWIERHRPIWYGPNFFERHVFGIRGLYRTRDDDGGQTFDDQFARLVRMLRERQDTDGSFPFPPGHGGPTVAMGRAYSTAMAILILNVDRGLLPMDR